MAALEFSQFGDDLKDIIASLTADVASAWPDIDKTYVNRTFIEAPEARYAVIAPAQVLMSWGEGDTSIVEVLQTYQITVFLRCPTEDGSNVVFEKIDRADALIKLLCASIRYKGIYEMPQVTAVGIGEEEDREYWVLPIDFVVRAANYRYGAPA